MRVVCPRGLEPLDDCAHCNLEAFHCLGCMLDNWQTAHSVFSKSKLRARHGGPALPRIPAHGRLRKDKCHEFKASLSYSMTLPPNSPPALFSFRMPTDRRLLCLHKGPALHWLITSHEMFTLENTEFQSLFLAGE